LPNLPAKQIQVSWEWPPLLFFRWVIGGSHPAGIAADWLTSAWGQNTGNPDANPSAAAAETEVSKWLLDILDLSRESSIGFVTGATMANFVCLAAARHQVLAEADWDVESQGLIGSPKIDIFAGEEPHASIQSALRYLGLGSQTSTLISTDEQGCMYTELLHQALKASQTGPKIVITQAGQINTGAFDPFSEIADLKKEYAFWWHVDGAFGLWARINEETKSLTNGVERADSWATDGHKWLQTPYDCGYAIIWHETAHRQAMAIEASYLPEAEAGVRDPAQYVPELSRRDRGFASWAIIKSLGRQGISEIVGRHCRLAKRFAKILEREDGISIINTVVINQAIVRFGLAEHDDSTKDDLTQKTIEAIQNHGVCYLGGSIWKGRFFMRISIVSWRTHEADVERSAESIIHCWRKVRSGGKTE
jgi:glutamate/tyrosine decarboxylase-like PLP-dependent enzyme